MNRKIPIAVSKKVRPGHLRGQRVIDRKCRINNTLVQSINGGEVRPMVRATDRIGVAVFGMVTNPITPPGAVCLLAH